MYQDNEIRQIVKEVLKNMMDNQGAPVPAGQEPQTEAACPAAVEEGYIPDITAVSTKDEFYVPDPTDREGYISMKQYTVARLGVWRAGPRYNTRSLLHFRADHATAQDAVFSDVDEAFVKEQGFVAGKSQCGSKDEFLTRPDLGRLLDDETTALFEKELPKRTPVTLMVGDGLSSAAMVNIPDIIPAIKQGLKGYGIEVGPIPYIKYCRVGAMDQVGKMTDSEVVCVLIGERPGLATGESMSAYICYKPGPERPESWRTVVSNIYRGGTPPAEAGAHIATLLKQILDARVSGVDLKL